MKAKSIIVGAITCMLISILPQSMAAQVEGHLIEGHPKINKWLEQEFYNTSCPLSGTYSAGSGEKMQLIYTQAKKGADCILWMGEKTWIEISEGGDNTTYELSDGGTGTVKVRYNIGKSSSNGSAPTSFSSGKLYVTYNIMGWRTRSITLDGSLYTRTGMQNGWRMEYRKK